MRRAHLLLAASAGMVIGVMALNPASATSEDELVAPQIAAVMAEVPGGVVIDANHAVWPALDMTMTVPAQERSLAPSSVGGCATGSVCAFDGPNLTGSHLSWGSCGTYAVPGTFSVKSIADARSSGWFQARNGTTPLATAYAGGWVNVPGVTTRLRCAL